MHGPLGRIQRQVVLRREQEADEDAGRGAPGARQVVSAYLKGGREMYVRSDALAVSDRDGRTILEIDAEEVRSAVAPGARTVRVTWSPGRRGPEGAEGGGRSYCDLELDMKRMYPDRADRRAAEGSEAPSLARTIVAVARARLAALAGRRWRADAAQLLREAAREAGGAVGPEEGAPLAAGPCSGRLVVGPGERIFGEYDGVQWLHGDGTACVTGRGVYLVDPGKGLCLDLPFELFEGCDVANRTVSMRYGGGRAGAGRSPEEEKGGAFDLRVPGSGARAMAGDILEAYSRCGEADARRLGELEAKFARLAPTELLVEAYGKQREWEGERVLDEYTKLLAARRWGAWYGSGSELYDHRAAAACVLAGVPVEAAGGLTAGDRRLHGALRGHAEARAEYEERIRPLLADLFSLQTDGLPESEKRGLLAVPHWRIIHETIEEAARSGRRPGPSFVAPTARRYELLAADIGARRVGGGAEDWDVDAGRSALGLGRGGCASPCPWTGEEAARVLARPGYAEALAECDAVRAEYGMLDIVSPRALSVLAGRRLLEGARVRAGRAYEAWASGVGSGSGSGSGDGRAHGESRARQLPPFTDPYDYSWIQYLVDNMSRTADELVRIRLGERRTMSSRLREAHARSQEARARVAGSPVPPSAPREGVHGDAWYDPGARLWFTANTLGGVADSPLAAAGPDECERLHGVRATAFAARDVAVRHGLPAVRDGREGLWALLPTVPDGSITKEMVVDMERGSLNYACEEAEACITNEGLLCEYTHAEYSIICASDALDMPVGSEAREWAIGSAVLPLPERMRRFEFAIATDLLGVSGRRADGKILGR